LTLYERLATARRLTAGKLRDSLIASGADIIIIGDILL